MNRLSLYYLKPIVLASLISLSCFQPIALSSQVSNQSTTEPELGTVPGIYYDPSGSLSPSLNSMGSATEGGIISFKEEDLDNRYNIQRVWSKGASGANFVKVGDIQNNETLNQLIEIDNLSLGDIAEAGGATVETIPLSTIGLISNMSLGDLVEFAPDFNNQSINLLFSAFSLTSSSANSTVNVDLLKEFATNSAFENVSVAELLSGDWSSILDASVIEELQNLVDDYPNLSILGVDKLESAWEFYQSSLIEELNNYLAVSENLNLGDLLTSYPELNNLPIGALISTEVVVGDIEGLADVEIGNYEDLSDKYLSELANFGDVNGSSLIGDSSLVLLLGDVFGRLDIPFAGDVETPITNVVTGGTKNQEFKPEPCEEISCKHFEIVDVLSGIGDGGNLQGKAWIQGSSQSVPGGKGILRVINGGQERTGVSVWSPEAHVKLSLEDIDEGGNGEPATAQIWLDFQICISVPFVGEQCTPHFLSFPTPWKVQEKGLILVFSRQDAPDIVQNIGKFIRQQNGSLEDYQQTEIIATDCSPTDSINQSDEKCPSDTLLATGTLANPAPGYPITSGFGKRKSPCEGCSTFHPAVDIGTPTGTPIKSADGGKVIGTQYWDGYGYTVVIDHGNGIKTRYSHLDQINVQVGQTVSQGDVIALSGHTGYGTGPHLDFGVYQYEGSDWRTPKSAAIDPTSIINF